MASEAPLLAQVAEGDQELASTSGNAARSLDVVAGSMALTGTMLGGGLLSLPYAASFVGLSGAVVLILASGAVNVFSYELIASSARLAGPVHGKSFNSLAAFALGETHGRRVALSMLLVLCFLASVGYLLLCGKLAAEALEDRPHVSSRRVATLGAAFLVTPLSLFKNVHALRYANLFTVLAAVLLMVAVVVKSTENGRGTGVNVGGPNDISDLMFAMPFFLLAFSAQFSVLPVLSELVHPTAPRMQFVTRSAGVLGAIIYTTIAVAGYLFTGDKVCDSIFSNFDRRDFLCTLGRVAVIVSLILSYPLLIMPCRGVVFDLCGLDDNAREVSHSATTLAIVAISCLCAVLAPNVAVVWSLAGSTVTIWISFTLPSLFFLEASKQDPSEWVRRIAAHVLFVFSVVASVGCSVMAVLRSSSSDACAGN